MHTNFEPISHGRANFSGSNASQYAGLATRRRGGSFALSGMTFVEALQRACESGCAIRPVGERHTFIEVRPLGARNDLFLHVGGKNAKTEIGAYNKAAYYLMNWELVGPAKNHGTTLRDIFPELRFCEAEETKLRLSDMLPESKPERRWRLKDLF